MRSANSSEQPTALRTRRRDVVELALGYALILAVIWTPRPWQRGLYVLAAVSLAVMLGLSFRTLDAMGLRTKNLLRSFWIVPVAVVVSGAIVAWSGRAGTLERHGAGWFAARYWGYALWSLVQQILLQDFFLGRIRRLVPGRPAAAVWLAAGVFAAAHLPNPILTPMTLLWGALACALFLRYRNLWPLALAHALFGMTLATTMPKPILRNMRVGLGYLEYPRTHPAHPHIPRKSP
jgi:hypothetical protein